MKSDQPIIQIVGARPNFMKAAPVIAAGQELGLNQILVHTGQHYDRLMSDVFFADLGIPEPDVNLGVGSGTHATQTATLMIGLEKAFVDHDPRLIVVYGDVNSTLAAAVTASKLGYPIAHVEAGLRSFDRTMPEEINRVVTDMLADVLFATSPEATRHLANEGISADRVHLLGNPMIDTLLKAKPKLDVVAARDSVGINGPFALSTLHRPANVDDPRVARSIVNELTKASNLLPIVIPLHPRGRAVLEAVGLMESAGIRVVDPLGYTDFVALMSDATVVITDSGGIQEETTMLDVPCLTVRPNTERPITLTHGTNRLVTPLEIHSGVASVLNGSWSPPTERPPLWDGNAGPRIAEVVASSYGNR